MKKLIIVFGFIVSLTQVTAQKDMSNVFDGKTKITFLGLDFNLAKFIGKEGFNDTYKIETYYLQRWNEVIVEEYDKFQLKDALRLGNYETSTDDLIVLNDGYSVKDNLQNSPYSISETDVKKSVKKYKIEVKEGIGISYVVESFNKLEEGAFVWVTFIDLSSNTVILTERMKGRVRGFGFRNYWLGAIYDINKQVKSRYKIWKKKFKKK